MKKPPLVVMFLAIGAFLLPLLGGSLSTDALPIMPDDNLLGAILGGHKAPLFAHLAVSLFFIVPLLNAIFRRKIMHVPSLMISIPLSVFAGVIGLSIIFSDFRHTTAVALVDWSLMIGAYYAVTTSSGRKSGNWVIFGLVCGISVCALFGIREFQEMRTIDPGYRIFALQLNPNQAGALFGIGICLAVPLMLQLERLQKLILCLAISMMGFALALTQSKGAILCAAIGVAVLVISTLALKIGKENVGKVALATVLPLALAGVMVVGAQNAARVESKKDAPLARFANAQESSVQSVGFRKLLWESAADLSKQRPIGWGLGSYWYESTRPGKVTQTVLAHQTWLQLMAEATVLAPVSLLLFFAAVFGKALKGACNLPADTKLNLISAVSGLAVAISHNFVDSDMYIFGLGAIVFILCGTLTSSSVDSQSPEVVFAIPRISIVATAAIVLPLALSLSFAEIFRAKSRGFEAVGDLDRASQMANAALSVSFADGKAFYQRFRLDRKRESILAAVHHHPSPKFYRALADYESSIGSVDEALSALDHALERDPNNAQALLQYVIIANNAGKTEQAITMAKKLIESEKSTYFTVRSQPEFIPTQTYEVRTILAKLVSNEDERDRLRLEALKGYMQYRDITVPILKRAFAVSKDADIAGENANKAAAKLGMGIELCDALDRSKVGQLDLRAERASFEESLAGLLK